MGSKEVASMISEDHSSISEESFAPRPGRVGLRPWDDLLTSFLGVISAVLWLWSLYLVAAELSSLAHRGIYALVSLFVFISTIKETRQLSPQMLLEFSKYLRGSFCIQLAVLIFYPSLWFMLGVSLGVQVASFYGLLRVFDQIIPRIVFFKKHSEIEGLKHLQQLELRGVYWNLTDHENGNESKSKSKSKDRTTFITAELMCIDRNSVLASLTSINRVYSFLKRLFDILVAGSLMLILLPIMGLICLCIAVDTGRPFLFRQARVGEKGRIFSILKFRSMYLQLSGSEATPQSDKDPRITQVGRWLRRFSLDELPQLINVLKGEMSLVGPRPEMGFIVQQYNELQRLRLEVKPGVTGLWQISQYRGAPIHENVELDLFYILHRGFFFDFAILLKTGYRAIKGMGAF